MPNSYIHNPEEHLDGQSMSDWFTGSGCVLTKVLVREAFGIEPTLDGITVAPASFIPAKSCSITTKVKGRSITVNYENFNTGRRIFTVNGETVNGEYDTLSMREKLSLTPDKDYVITVTD